MTPRTPSLPFIVVILMTGAMLLACGQSGNSGALTAPGISTVVITPIGAQARAQAVAIQTDGKIVAAGYAHDGATNRNVFALARYSDVDGGLDTLFNPCPPAPPLPTEPCNGIVTAAIGADDAQAQAVAIQPDPPNGDLLVVAGFAYIGGQYRFAVARYHANGSPDTSFNGGDNLNTTGTVTTAIGSIDDRAFAVAIQSTGEIVVAGYSSEDTGTGSIRSRVALVRYNTDGSPDSSFNGGDVLNTTGIITTLVGTSAGAFALTTQTISAVDYLVVAGFAYTGAQNEFLAVRYKLLDGSLDATSFGTGGIVTTAIGTVNDQAYAVAIQSDGKIVAAGLSYASGQSSIALARYTSAGSLDTTFNTTGKVTTAILTDAAAFAVRVYTDAQLVEHILVAGSAYNSTYGEFVLARYINDGLTDGALDGTFGSGGRVDTKITYGSEAFGLVIQSGGKPIAAGYSQDKFKQESFTLVRYSDTGVVDTTFPPPP